MHLRDGHAVAVLAYVAQIVPLLSRSRSIELAAAGKVLGLCTDANDRQHIICNGGNGDSN